MPPSANSFKTFTDFLQDKQFVHWKFFPMHESEVYWNDFLKQHPHLTPLFREAEEHFVNIKIEKDTLSQTEKQQLWQTICRDASCTTTTIKWLKIALVTCAAIALIIVLNDYFSHNQLPETEKQSELIVGSLLNSEDIRLVAGGNSLSFQNDVQVQVDAAGKAKIIQENQAEKTVEITNNTPNKLIVPYGKRSEILLADGTKACLNSGSTLEFPASFDGVTREVRLSGEMYIEVAPDKRKPFYVHTNGFTVHVLGTKFNISAYNNFTNAVALLEGSVQLKSTNGHTAKLMVNQQAVYERDGSFKKETVNVSNIISWKDGYWVFEETPVLEVLKSIERYYNLSFNYEQAVNFRHITCKGKLNLSDNLDNVMNSIAFLSAFTYERKNDTIYIIENTEKNKEANEIKNK